MSFVVEDMITKTKCVIPSKSHISLSIYVCKGIIEKDTGEILEDGHIPDVVVQGVHGIVAGMKQEEF